MSDASKRIKTPRDAKGPNDLKILERTTASVLQSRMPPRSAINLKHCHFLNSSRHVMRIDKQPWEERVGNMLQLYENHRFNRANALHNSLQQVQVLLLEAQERERELQTTTEELQRTSSYLQTLMDAMVDSLIATDLEGTINQANKATERMSGLSREMLVGCPFASLFEDPQLATESIHSVLEQGTVSDYELTLIHQNGHSIPVMFNATVLLDLDQNPMGVLINARDISELKKAQQAMETYARELARANEDLKEFAAVASHDLEDPLKQVTEYATNLAERYRDEFDERAQQDLNFMVKQAVYMQKLIKDVLAYSQIDSEQVVAEIMDSNAVLQQALTNLHAVIEESDTLVSHDALPEIRGNRAQVIRIFQNLIGNAVKYRDSSKKRNRIHVTAERVEDSELALPPEVKGTEGWLFTVMDNGIGIDAEFIQDVFKMFVRLHKASEYSGSGMGLAIVWKVVRRHTGHVWLESELGKGSAFHFVIPD